VKAPGRIPEDQATHLALGRSSQSPHYKNGCDKYQYHKGRNCGIFSAVCPYGLKVLKKG